MVQRNQRWLDLTVYSGAVNGAIHGLWGQVSMTVLNGAYLTVTAWRNHPIIV